MFDILWMVPKSCITKRMVETLQIMGCLPPINLFFWFFLPSTVVLNVFTVRSNHRPHWGIAAVVAARGTCLDLKGMISMDHLWDNPWTYMDDICINIYIYMEIYGDIWRYNDICNYITISYKYNQQEWGNSGIYIYNMFITYITTNNQQQ